MFHYPFREIGYCPKRIHVTIVSGDSEKASKTDEEYEKTVCADSENQSVGPDEPVDVDQYPSAYVFVGGNGIL